MSARPQLHQTRTQRVKVLHVTVAEKLTTSPPCVCADLDAFLHLEMLLPLMPVAYALSIVGALFVFSFRLHGPMLHLTAFLMKMGS